MAVPGGEDARGLRQWPTLESLVRRVAQTRLFLGGLLIGSFARGVADAMSDIDLILVPPDESFDQAWHGRQDMHGSDVLAAWDEQLEDRRGAHKWLTAELVFVECLIATPGSGLRLAQPFVVVVGNSDLPNRLKTRPPVKPSDMSPARHPIERAYDELKHAVRDSRNN